MSDKKSHIRKEVLRKRDSIDILLRRTKDRLIKERLFSLPEFEGAEVIFYFASFRSEVSTLQQIEDALRLGKRILLPVVDKRLSRLRLFEIKDIAELSPGSMGIPEPSVPQDREREINDAGLVIMPGAAFDAKGNRIGYGAGFYDKLLAGLKKQTPLIAIAFEEQMVDSIPAEPHDVRVHKVVTDARVIECLDS